MTTGRTPRRTTAARILIVDDHPVVRLGLAHLIGAERDLEVCGEAPSAAAALSILDKKAFDLAVIDISLEDGSGIDLIKQIKSRHPKMKMLVSSMHEDTLYAGRALDAGAHGYLNKQEATDQIVGAIRRILGGKVYLSEEMTERLLEFREGTEPKIDPSPAEVLSDRELEVFELISRGNSTSQIAGSLRLSVKTIEAHRENIKKKLKLRSHFELVRKAVKWTMEKDE